MDALTTSPPLQLDDPPDSEWNQLDMYSVSADPDHTSLDEGMFQQVRDRHGKIETYLKALPVNEECIANTVDEIVGIDCPLPVKFSKVDVPDLIKKNKNIKGSESLSTLVSALGLLEKYGRNLMKSARPKQWKLINFANGVFRTRVDIVKGARDVLQLMGYSEVVEDGLRFPLDVDSPNFDQIAIVVTDLLIAKRETDLYQKGEHPHAYRFKDCLDGTIAMIQLPSDSPNGRPQSFFMRRPTSDVNTVYENFRILQPPEHHVSAASKAGSAITLDRPPLPRKPILYDSSVNPSTKNNGISHKIDVVSSQFVRNPDNALVVQNTISTVQLFSETPTQKELILPDTSIQLTRQDTELDMGSECVMCGNSTANVQCSSCSGLRCDSCDKKWHRHPDRRSHSRKVMERIPVIASEPSGPILSCDVCGVRVASMFCHNCNSSSCSDCDMICHGHPLRQNHSREPVRSGYSDQSVSKAPPQNIVLSPVIETSTAQEAATTTEQSVNSTKKRPVPAPRRNTLKEPSEHIIPEGQVLMDDVFETYTTSRVPNEPSNVREPSRKVDRGQSESAIQGTNDVPLSPKPFHSLPTDKSDIMSEIQTLVQKDIDILQHIQNKRDVIATCQKGSTTYIALQNEISSLLLTHNDLRIRQEELEAVLASISSTQEVEMQQPPADHPQDLVPVPGISTVENPPLASNYEASRSTRQNSQAASTNVPFHYQGPSLAVSMAKPVEAATAPSISATRSQSRTPSRTAPSLPTTKTLDQPRAPPSQSTVIHHAGPKAPAKMSTTANSSSGSHKPWVCLQCGNLNAASASSTVCATCPSSASGVPPQKPSVAALSYQIGPSIPMPISQHKLQTSPFLIGTKDAPRSQTKPKDAPRSQTTASQAAAPTPLPASVARAKTQPVNIFTYLQQQEEEMLKEKQKAKEEDEQQMAAERKEGLELPTPPPRIKRETKRSTDLPSPTVEPSAGGHIQQSPLNASAKPFVPVVTNRHALWLEEKKRLDEQRAKSQEFISLLQNAEAHGFYPEEVAFASEIMKGQEDNINELQWLQNNWSNYIETVRVMATTLLQKEVGKSVGVVSKEEARRSLRKHGDAEKAVEECVTEMQKRVVNLVEMGFSHRSVCESLFTSDGGMGSVIDKLQRERAADYVNRLWHEEDVASLERLIVDLGVHRHPDSMERRLRILLAEYELKSWGRAFTAVQLIDTGKYEINDAITAARECGDLERAKQYLEKECQVCYAQFSMNKLSTLIHCQCMICLECLQTHFKVIINNRNILNATCPACDLPDLRGNDLDAIAEYFGFLDILLKGFLDSTSYQLFQDKMRDWNLMKEENFRWCAHCGNGFINEAPNRRKMRCNECNQLTCFQCKKPWMEQHENTTCAEFQAWKEANDPNRAAEGLAIHLKENGIDCPHCKMRYELAKGGCMHFKCVQCTYEFCCGCSSPFKTDCSRFASCLSKGFHAHHPRDCLFYLRDQDIKALQKLLQKNRVDFKKDNPANQQPHCSVKEQKELPDGLNDAQCGREAVHAGLCNLHYKEYLVSLINQNHIDPATEFDAESLTIILQRNELPVPGRRDRESEGAYNARLLQDVKEKLPLEKKNPRDRAQST